MKHRRPFMASPTSSTISTMTTPIAVSCIASMGSTIHGSTAGMDTVLIGIRVLMVPIIAGTIPGMVLGMAAITVGMTHGTAPGMAAIMVGDGLIAHGMGTMAAGMAAGDTHMAVAIFVKVQPIVLTSVALTVQEDVAHGPAPMEGILPISALLLHDVPQLRAAGQALQALRSVQEVRSPILLTRHLAAPIRLLHALIRHHPAALVRLEAVVAADSLAVEEAEEPALVAVAASADIDRA